MVDWFGSFPVAPFLFALIIPIIYSIKNRKEIKSILIMTLCSICIVVLYPITSLLSNMTPLFGYSLGKLLLFVVFPTLTVLYIERWNIKKIFNNLGVVRENLRKSIFYGMLASVITIVITFLIISNTQFDIVHSTILFFESFTEEFFFRGFLFLYLMRKTSNKIAFVTSTLGFILIHPQNFDNLFIISTAAQGILMTVVTYKTKNIIGPWIGHGLNRVIPSILKMIIP